MVLRNLITSIAGLLVLASTFAQDEIAIIPQPQLLEKKQGRFVFSSATWVSPLPEGKDWINVTAALRDKLVLGAGIYLAEHPTQGGNTIRITHTASVPAEGYELDIKPESIQIKASSPRGAFYAVQTILQLLPATIESPKPQKEVNGSIPCVYIKDKPTFAYRGLMLDVSRHFMLAGDMKKLIDALAMQKINTLHWHLTDNEGWRFESKKYPKLTETGAFRKGVPNNMTYDYASRPREEVYGGFYTQDQMRDIVAYAKKKFIDIIPEIDLPAHSTAAMASYPELLCVDSAGNKRKDYDFGDGTLCTRDANFKFLFAVLDELLAVFPSKYIHLGGDEAYKVNWKACADCNKLMKEKELKNYEELQSYFVKRISNYLLSKGRKPIGWDEILEGGLAPNTTVMSWRSEKGGIDAVKQGHQAIMTPVSHCYYDYYQSREDDEPIAWGGYIPLEKVYNYKPVPAELSPEQAKLILGAQGNLWTENVPDFVQAAYMIFPRISALSEVLWTNAADRNYAGFVSRLENISNRLKWMGVYSSHHRYEIKFATTLINEGVRVSVEGSGVSIPVRVTTDGSLPGIASPVYKEPFLITNTAKLTAAIVDANGKVTDKATVQFTKHKGLDAMLTQLVPPSKYYNSGGDRACANGLAGIGRGFKDNEWLGWNGKPFTGLYKFETLTDITTINTRFYNDVNSWIWYPKFVEVLVSDNGTDFVSVYSKEMEKPKLTGPIPYSIALSNVKTKYLKIIVTPISIIPKGFNGADNPTWIFVDEVVIN